MRMTCCRASACHTGRFRRRRAPQLEIKIDLAATERRADSAANNFHPKM